MKLLILTQKVNKNDPILGFFHRWIEEFAKHCEQVIVICLEKGVFNLPNNVKVLSLGKENGQSRVKYLLNFYRYIWQERRHYDSVFVHMNQEYVLLGGLFWRLWSKPLFLWYTHKSVGLKLRLATFLSNKILTASKESFRLSTSKLHIMGHGVDTDFFYPNPDYARESFLLSVGRLMESKRHDLAIRASVIAGKKLRIVGEGPNLENLKKLAESLSGQVSFLGGFTQKQLRDEYWRAAFLIHTSETGSLDKVVLEALICGLSVITTNHFFVGLPVTIVSPDPKAIAKEIVIVDQKKKEELVSYVRNHHSLQRLIASILVLFKTI